MSRAMQDAIMERVNYHNDRRVRALSRATHIDNIDERAMTGTITVYDEDDEESELTVPLKYEVCDTCGGRGSHVNPSIDSGGIGSDDDFWDDDYDDGESRYMRGDYDVTCYECKGKRVVLVLADDAPSEVVRMLEERERDEAEYHAERMAEMRMGC